MAIVVIITINEGFWYWERETISGNLHDAHGPFPTEGSAKRGAKMALGENIVFKVCL